MARTVRVGEFQRMQRAGQGAGPSHTSMGEMDAVGDGGGVNGRDVAAVDQLTGQVVDSAPVDPKPEDRADPLADLMHGSEESDYPTESDVPCDECGGVVMLNSAEEDRRLASRVAEGVEIEVLCDGCAAKSKPGDREPTVAEKLEALNVEARCTAEMPRSLVVGRIREASYGMHPAPTEEDIQAEADRIWTSFGENRTGPAERQPDWRDVVKGRDGDDLDERVSGRAEKLAGELGRGLVADVGPDGIVEGVRPAEMTPDRGPDVGTTVHQVGDEEPRFSGGGADDSTASDKIPSDADFRGKLYLEAPELANIAEGLIGQHGFLDDLRHCDIRWYWKRKTGVSKGRVKIGFMKRASDLLGHFSGADFIGWLSATTARDGRFTDDQVEAAVFHQLLHIGSDDKGNWIFVPHDFEGFAQEVRHYGTWTEGLKLGGTAFVAASQMGLFDAADEDEDDDEEEDVAGEVIEQVFGDEPADPDRPFDDEEPDTAGELPTGEEIDAAMTDRDLA